MPLLLLLLLLNDMLNQAWLNFAGPAPHLQLCCLVKTQVDNTPVCSQLLEHDNVGGGIIAKDSASNFLQPSNKMITA